jgi:hypothetical protein
MGFNSAFKGLIAKNLFKMAFVAQRRPVLTLNLLTTTIVAPPSNASNWQMGFNSVFKGLIAKNLVKIATVAQRRPVLTLSLLTTTIVAPPSNASN